MNDIFRFTWDFFQSSFRYLITLTAPFALLSFLTYMLISDSEGGSGSVTGLGIGLNVLIYSMFMSSLIFFMSQKYMDRVLTPKANIINGAVYTPLLVVTVLLANIFIIAAGLIIFAIPELRGLAVFLGLFGVYVSLKSTFAPFHLVLEGQQPLSAIKSSFASTTGYIGKIVLLTVLFHLSTIFVDAFTDTGKGTGALSSILILFGVMVNLLLVAFEQIAVFKLYIESFEGAGNEFQGNLL